MAGWPGVPRGTLILEDLMRSGWFTPAWILELGAVLRLVGGALYIVLLVRGRGLELVEGPATTFHMVGES
jgi:hypothetical protein